jgi:DNA-binding CsgD family transcriptional regulator
MNSLDMFSVRTLMRALEQIHSTKDLSDLPQVLFSTLKSLVPGAMVTFDLLDPTTKLATTRISEDSLVEAEVKARVLELMPTHPIVPTLKSGAKGAIRVTDCITQRQFRHTPHYCETLRPIGVDYQTVITLDIPGKIGTTTVLREKDLDVREVELLRLIAPHIALAYCNAARYTAVKRTALRTIPAPEELQKIGLTVREGEVLHWVIQGKRDAEIAAMLSTSPRTIQNHVRSILQKLNVETRTGAALEATDRLKRSRLC